MHAWHWLVTGLIAGLIARLVLKKTHMSLAAELALGGLGGLTCGALMRFAGVTDADSGDAVHILVALTGAIGTIAAIHFLWRMSLRAGKLIATTIKPVDLNGALANLGDRERRVLGKFLRREIVSRNANVEVNEQSTVGQRAADKIANFGGSWAFIGLFLAVLVAWMLYNQQAKDAFDPYPFILLNLVLSCIAAIQAPIILMSQNRQSQKDRIQAQLDYEVNLKSEVEILALHDKLDALRDQEWRETLL
ncbi:MAG TPA: DUF1003 domain-containing protein, partial [Spongiibacteraceae bacterium]|nr:DUF1003 domain-containing protein [Spongiibacteraceae bacterium]